MDFRHRDVVWVDLSLGGPVGDEMPKTRPCVVISPDVHNRNGRCILVVPISTLKVGRNPGSTEVFLPKGEGDLRDDSVALPLHVRSIDPKHRVKEQSRGSISEESLSKIVNVLYQFTKRNY